MNNPLYPVTADRASPFDRTIIRNHVWMLHHLAERTGLPGKLVLSAIPPTKDAGLYVVNQHFQIGDVDGMTAATMAFEGKPYGLYAPYCIMRHDLPEGERGTKEDVIATLAYAVDADSDHQGKVIPHAPVDTNYEIESSPGNFQEVIILDRALKPADSKPLALALKEVTGDKKCVGDISRIMRIPGTLNWPNEAKLKRGRPPDPQPIKVHKPWKSWTTVESLRAAVASYIKPDQPEQHSDGPPALNGYRIEEVSWWLDQKIKGSWKDDPDSPLNDNGEWIATAKAIKLNFPDDDGWTLVTKFTRDPDALRPRWDKKSDFKTEYVKGMRTLKNILEDSRDTAWMFRHVSGCPTPPAASVPHYEIPQAVLDQLNAERERYLAASIGPLPDHPELPMNQAETLCQFWAHLPSGKIIHEASRQLWAAGSFDKHCGRIKDAMKTEGPGMLASTWLSQHRAVQSMGWDPGEPMIIEGRILAEDWVRAPNCRTFNIYLPPAIVARPGDVSIWLDHIRFIYPAEADHIVLWFAHRVQRPGEKVNHGLVFIGDPGIGKDTAIEPVVAAIGSQNFKSITAARFFKSDFNGYLKSVMLRIDEVHDLGGESKYAFHDRTKPVLAAPPASHEINEKHIPHHSARNVCGVILTSNHGDALYLDRNDRRHYVCISDRKKEDFREGYFEELYGWFDKGGNEAVAHFLRNLDLSAFNPKTPPPKTAGWHMVVTAGLAPESGDLADVIEAIGKPAALTLAMIRQRTPPESQLRLTFEDAKLRRNIPKRLAECGYIAVANPDARESGGRWRVPPGNKTTIYARQELGEGERVAAARALSIVSPVTVPMPPY